MDNKKGNGRTFGLCCFILCFVYCAVLLGTGLNSLAPFAMALAAIIAIIIFLRTLFNKPFDKLLWASFVYTVLETFLYFLVWGADEIGRIIWWNLLLAGIPAGLSIFMYVARRHWHGSFKKFATGTLSLMMAATSVVYVFYMSLRAKPSVASLWQGHNEYLNSLDESNANENAPNVLVVLMDDMGFSDISCYGYMAQDSLSIETPVIDSLASEGVLMENFYASAPVCTPSRYSLLTGRYAARGYLDNVIFPTVTDSDPYSMTHFINPFQFLHNVDGLLGDEITLAEVLQAVGYNTACIGKWNLGDYGEYLPTNQGFDYFFGSYYVNDMTPYNWVREVGGQAEEVRSHAENLDQSESTRLFTEEIKDYISDSVSKGEKFFVNYTTPWPHYPIYSDNNGNGKGDTSDDSYIDCIEEFDTYLGQIIDLLKETGVYDDTLIIFTSDNGPGREGGAGAHRGRKNTTFEGGMKVPLIAVYNNGGIGKGSLSEGSIQSPAMLIDIFPTILSYVGVDILPTDRIIDGKNLKSLWNGEVAADTHVHDALYYMKRGKVQAVQMPVEIDGTVYDFKYYERVHSENSAFIDQFYNNYLFNLDNDPMESYNVSMIHPEVAQQLYENLQAFRKSLKENRRGIL